MTPGWNGGVDTCPVWLWMRKDRVTKERSQERGW
jgi:hypothetical protein